MNSIIDQGKNITSALNELEKFFIEVNSLQILLKDKLDKFLDTSIKFKAYNQEESFCFSDSNWLFPWYNIRIAMQIGLLISNCHLVEKVWQYPIR